ncbi:hypothetical protein [Bradyrhizobium sp. SZCCHNS3002]|uniref:hypothetical protein n=1 Tax=Bradyrhizobium sp. SZCCHNS3002 TaxID=3057310 RepID=UPI0028EDFC47|nr:hypothetical protein [Bradyrhizobium sp. SZCCHNS3002]
MQQMIYVEIDLPMCSLTYGVAPCTASIPSTGTAKCYNSKATCQDRAHYTQELVTLRFAKPADYLSRGIDAIPSIQEISYSPATMSLGESLGTRATLTVTFRDHLDSDTGPAGDRYLADRNYDPFALGTFWGKFRARQPFLRGAALRWRTFLFDGGTFTDLDTRHFIIDSTDGPTADGKFTVIAKDVLKLADGDRAQAPKLSTGFLAADITNSQGSAALLPAGIGNAEYPTAGYLMIGGNEVVQFSRSGDNLTILRGVLGTTAAAHKAQDRCQLVLYYLSQSPSAIIRDLLVNYAGIDAGYINMTEWEAEDSTFLGNVYTAVLCEPTSVSTLVSELIQQAALAVWPDEVAQKIRYQVLRAVSTNAATFTPDNTLQGSLTLKDQPDKRLSRVQVYFGRKDPTKPLSNLDNYVSTSLTIDGDAEGDYGSPAIKTILSRWIPQAGRSVADRLGAIMLGRFRDPPRKVTLATARYAGTDIGMGGGYLVRSFCIQDASGAPADLPIQVTRLDPRPDRFAAEAEEMLWTAPDTDANVRYIIFDANRYNINLRTEHDSIYPAPVSGNVINAIINNGVLIGSNSSAVPSFNIGIWPGGVTINLIIAGAIIGAGGAGGTGGSNSISGGIINGSPGGNGGTALYARSPVNVTYTGALWGGGGGGGGGTAGIASGGGGGGGGAGVIGGTGGGPGYGDGASGTFGGSGTLFAGGGPGGGGAIGTPGGSSGGAGGGPGAAGGAGANVSGRGSPGAGGGGGRSIDGLAYITFLVNTGDTLGSAV